VYDGQREVLGRETTDAQVPSGGYTTCQVGEAVPGIMKVPVEGGCMPPLDFNGVGRMAVLRESREPVFA
jgi:hypothetical protein